MSTPVSVISWYPAATSASTCSTTTFGSWLRLAPRALGTMQNAQRCWQPSWILTEARERPDTRENGATGTPRAVLISPTVTSGRRRFTREVSSSGSRYFSWLPITRSTPGSRVTAWGSVWA